MHYPEFAKIGDKKYKINTDFRVAIECQEIAMNEAIGDYERALAVIYKLFGKEGLKDDDNHVRLLELAQKFLCCDKEVEPTKSDEQPDIDYVEDMDYIEASFMSDYNIDLTSVDMHWWKFFNLLNGLSNSELGNCCVLNRVRNLRSFDTKDIKDPKELQKVAEAKKQVAIKRYQKENNLTDEQLASMNKLNEILGIREE